MRTATAAELAVLADPDAVTHCRLKIEDPDGTMGEITALEGIDWLDECVIDVRTEPVISTAQIKLARTVDLLSLAPLIEGSTLNRNAAGSYAARLNPNRSVTIETATKLPGETPLTADWKLLWEGLTKRIEWGGSDNQVVIDCLDPMTRLSRTFIPTVGPYGDDAGTEDMEDVIQEILDDNFGTSAITLAVPAATSFPILEYDLGNVTVLEALQELANLNAFNLHWRWNSSAGAFRLTLWEPDRSNTTADHTFGPDDYHEIPSISLDDEGIRNDGEVVYTDTSRATQTETDTRSTSIALYGTRFIRIDARESAVVNGTQAGNLIGAILDDLESPPLPQEVDAAFFWPIELGDLHAYSPNEHYDTEQKLAVFAYRHVITPAECRTHIFGSGKPSGGYERWHTREPKAVGVARTRRYAPEEFGSSGGPLQPSGTGSPEEFFATVGLPIGAVITAIRSRAARRNAGDAVEVALFGRWQYLGSPPTSVLLDALATPNITHSVDSDDWTVEEAAIAEVEVRSTGPDRLGVSLEAASTVTDAQLAWVELDYIDPLTGRLR